MKKRKIVAVIENHFDQIWRRCLHSDFVHKGQNFVSYEKIEQYYIDENLRLVKENPNYKFQIETPCVVETYLNRFPEREEEIRKLYEEGVLKTTNTGYIILDSNMTGPETTIRNYLIADAFFAKYMKKSPEIASRRDAFGNSAQLPQIMKAFGIKYLADISYTAHNDDVWIGLDGRSALCVKKYENLGGGGGWYKYRPCGDCNGFGTVDGKTCPVCEGKGIDIPYSNKRWHHVRLNDKTEDSGILRIGGEEFMPSRETPAEIEAIAREKNVDISFGHYDYLLELFQKEIDQVYRGDFSGLKVRQSPEFNPNNTGVYVSRILTKQRLCDAENKLLTGETLSAMDLVLNKKPFSYDAIWRNVMIGGFHDSVCGTIVDAGYDEIMSLYDEVDEVCREKYLKEDSSYLFNSTSSTFNGIYQSPDGQIAIIRDMAPYSSQKACFEDAPTVTSDVKQKEISGVVETVMEGNVDETREEATREGLFTVENEYFVVEADKNGICRITDKRFGDIMVETPDMRPCEWIWQSDVGSPWATIQPPFATERLSGGTRFIRIEKTDNYTKICYRTDFPRRLVGPLNYSWVDWSLMLANGVDRIHLDANVSFHTYNDRLMISFPMAVENGKDCYGIPGGMLNREPYAPRYSWAGANGDWPAFRFGGVESDSKSVAVLNRGTPAYRVAEKDGVRTLYVSLLRSPAMPTYLHEPESYSMTDFDGMRDEGSHSFSFEIAAYGTDFANSCVVKDAEQFARPLLPLKEATDLVEMPIVTESSATVTHIKPAEDGCGVIVRVTEHSGKDGNVTITIPEWVSAVYLSDLPERKAEPLEYNKTLTLPLHAYEIATLRLLSKSFD